MYKNTSVHYILRNRNLTKLQLLNLTQETRINNKNKRGGSCRGGKMPLCCLPCATSTVAVLVVALSLLMVPPSFLIRDAYLSSQTLENINGLDKLANLEVASPKNTYSEYFSHQSVDLLPSLIMLSIGLTVYLYQWIQRKLMERRILKMRAYLNSSLERLRETDARREQLEANLKLARGAAAEYNLLLYLLLRKRKDVPDSNQDNVA